MNPLLNVDIPVHSCKIFGAGDHHYTHLPGRIKGKADGALTVGKAGRKSTQSAMSGTSQTNSTVTPSTRGRFIGQHCKGYSKARTSANGGNGLISPWSISHLIPAGAIMFTAVVWASDCRGASMGAPSGNDFQSQLERASLRFRGPTPGGAISVTMALSVG